MFGRVPTPAPPPEEPEPAKSVDEAERAVAWRLAHLEAVGLPYMLAYELALAGVDWHRVARAVDRGASVDDVAAIFL